jgi:hypothetical protein
MGLQDKDEEDVNVPIDPSTSAKQLKKVLIAVEKVNLLWSVQNYS